MAEKFKQVRTVSMETDITKVEGYEEWMKNWLFFDKEKRVWVSYGPDNDPICSTAYPELAIKSFKYWRDSSGN